MYSFYKIKFSEQGYDVHIKRNKFCNKKRQIQKYDIGNTKSQEKL